MRASIRIDDPSEIQVEITLRGTLTEFEGLHRELADKDCTVQFYRVADLVGQISNASSRLRGRVYADPPEEGAAS